MELSFCVHCNQAILDTNHCPHCNSTQPNKGTIQSAGILMTAFLGLGVMACNDNDESPVEESNDAQPEVVLVDKGEKSDTPEETVQKQEPEKSEATEPEKGTDTVAEKDSEKDAQTPVLETIDTTAISDSQWVQDERKDLEKSTEEKQQAKPTAVKTPGGGLTMDRPGRPVGAKYGVPSVSVGMGAPKGQVRIGAVSTDDCDSKYTQRVFRKYRSQLRYCYELQLKQTSTLETTINVEVDVSKGKVSAVSIERNEANGDGAGSEPLGQCVQKKMKRWTFSQECTGTVQGTFSFKNIK